MIYSFETEFSGKKFLGLGIHIPNALMMKPADN